MLLRRSLHVVHRHGGNFLAVHLDEIEPQVKLLSREQLRRHALIRGEPERQAAEQVLLRVFDFQFGRFLVTDAIHLQANGVDAGLNVLAPSESVRLWIEITAGTLLC